MSKLWEDEYAGVDIKKKEEKETEIPEEYKWSIIEDIEKITRFVNREYEGLNYTEEHIREYKKEAVFKGIEDKRGIVGIISYKVIMNGEEEMTYVNFLSVRKSHRKKGIVNYLVREVIRISVMKGVMTGVYTSTDLHKNLTYKSTLYHYMNKPKKLSETGFVKKPKGMRDEVFKKVVTFDIKRKMNIEKVKISEEIIDKVNDFNRKYKVSEKYYKFNEELFECYIYKKANEIKGILIVYKLDYMIKKTIIKNGHIYGYYYDGVDLVDFMKNCIRKMSEYDCVTCLDIMDNKEIIEPLKMKPGTEINYYVFNKEINMFNTSIYNY